MEIRAMVAALLIVASLRAAAASPDASLDTYTAMGAQEQRIWAVVDPSRAIELDAQWSALGDLEASIDENGARTAWLLHRCRVSAQSNRLERVATHGAAERHADSRAPGGESLRHKCRQYNAIAEGRADESIENSYRAFHALDEDAPASLAGWIAYDYAKDAIDMGFLDDAVDAAGRSLAFATTDALPEWEAESLGVLALARAMLGDTDAALSTNTQAMQGTRDAYIRNELRVNRGWMLRQVGRLEEASLEYEAVAGDPAALVTHRLIAGVHLVGIRLEQDRAPEAARLLSTYAPMAETHGEAEYIAYLGLAKAHVLLAAGQTDEAHVLYEQHKAWFIENGLMLELADGLLKWTSGLLAQGESRRAAESLRESIALRRDGEDAQRKTNARFMDAVLESERKKREFLALQRTRDQDRAELARRDAERRAITLVTAAVMVIALLLVIGNLRLRRARRVLAETNAKLDYESSHDALTRIHNRRYFTRFLESALALPQPRGALVVLFDIDHFKKINDTHGHAAGDEVLRTVSGRIAARMRESDRVVRWGGEEFLIYVDAPASADQCAAFVKRLLEEVAATPVDVDGARIDVTASAGFALVAPTDMASFEKDVDAIDALLYRAKNEGRNRAIGRLGGDDVHCLQPNPLLGAAPSPA